MSPSADPHLLAPPPPAGSSNVQFRNVGNPGDVAKHAALVALAKLLVEADGPTTWVDTHAFQLDAPVRTAAWLEALRVLPEGRVRVPYLASQRSLATKGLYRCSTGLVLDAFAGRPLRVVCGEADPTTRSCLRSQLALEGAADALVLDDATALASAALPPLGDVLALVDPFTCTPALWQAVAPAIDALASADANLLCLVYTHDRGDAPTRWASLGSLVGPTAWLHAGRHRLALYARGPLAAEATRALVELGFLPAAPRSELELRPA